MNTSSWRPAAVYGVDPNLPRSQWFDLIKTAKDGGTIDTPHGGKITHVQDVADALTLAVGDDAVAGQFYNLVDGYMYWQGAAEFAKELTGSRRRRSSTARARARRTRSTRRRRRCFSSGTGTGWR